MKRQLLLPILGLLMLPTLNAQSSITLPEESPKAMVMQRIGLADVSITYHSPAVKGRKVWGDLVPYEQVWRCGANENTVFSTTHPLKIGGQDLPAGTYGLHMIPTEKEWTIIFSKNHTSWGSYFYKKEEDALRVNVTPVTGENVEWLSYTFTDRKPDRAVMELQWENLRVPLKISIDPDVVVIGNIKNELRSIPGFTWEGWRDAAKYCLDHNTNLDQGMKWAETSVNMNRNFSNLRIKAGLLEAKGEKEKSAEIMKEAMAIATEAELNQYGYDLLFAGKVTEAIDIFKTNVKRYPDSWNAYDSLGEGYMTAGDKPNAVKNYKTALSKAPEQRKPTIENILKKLES